jgi:hypothetical protein
VSQDKYTKLARGKPCQIRLPGCDGGGDTSVLAHYRSISLGAGIGKKPHSLIGAWSCFQCHELADGRDNRPGLSRGMVRLAHAEGVLRTIAALIKNGDLACP